MHLRGSLSADGKRVLFGGFSDKAVRLLDVESGKEIQRFEGSPAFLESPLSADGRRACRQSYDTTVACGQRTGKELKRLEGQSFRWLRWPSLRMENSRSGSYDKSIKLWTWRRVKRFGRWQRLGPLSVRSHTRGMARMPPQLYWGTTVSLWTPETGKELHRLRGMR